MAAGSGLFSTPPQVLDTLEFEKEKTKYVFSASGGKISEVFLKDYTVIYLYLVDSLDELAKMELINCRGKFHI